MLIVATFVVGVIEDDTYTHGPAPALLALTGAAAGVAAIKLSEVDWAWWSEPVAAIAGVTCVVLPAMLQRLLNNPPAGLVEFVPLVACVILGLALHWAWIAAGIVAFLAGATYTGRHPQHPLAVDTPYPGWAPLRVVALSILLLIAMAPFLLAIGPAIDEL